MGIYIRHSKRSRLLKYKYSSTDKSLTSKYILNPYWNWLVTFFPLNMAPNAITLLGLSLVFTNFLTLLYYNPTLACGPKPLHVSLGGTWDPLFKPSSLAGKVDFRGWLQWLGLSAKGAMEVGGECAPRWLFFTFAIGLFMYQSLDAIDGKQARRTGTSGPLGELFDHGCDAINTTLGVILTAAALNLGLDWWTIVCLIATTANFYLTTWEEFHTGTLFLSAFSGPVEGILLVVALFAVTGFVGPSYWDQGILSATGLISIIPSSLPIKDLPINECFLVFSAIGLFFNIASSTKNVYHTLPPATRNVFSLLKPLSRLLPYTLHTAAMVLWLSASPADLLHSTLLLPFLAFWGISFAHHVQLLILSHLTASPFPAWWKHPLLILSMLGAADANLKRFGFEPVVQTSPEAIKRTVIGALVLAFVVYSHFVWEVIGDICDFYQMNCLTIKHRKASDGRSPAEIAKARKEANGGVTSASSSEEETAVQKKRK